MNRYILKPFFLFVIFLIKASTGMAAQSSADVTVTPELLESARLEIMGESSNRDLKNEEYIIGHGDVLYVSVYGEGSMAATVISSVDDDGTRENHSKISSEGIRVRLDGRISLSHIGDVEVVGMTLTQLADYLKVLLKTAIDDPIVTTVLLQSNSRRYTVMGKVVNPGIYLIDFPITLVQAVARCGGFTEWANLKITVVRQKLNKIDRRLLQKNKSNKIKKRLFKKNTMKFDYGDFLDGNDLERNITIQADDIIIVH